MAKYTRGEFLGFGAALAGVYGAGRLPTLAAQTSTAKVGADADFIVVNAKVYTSDVAQPRAEAFAVKDGRFVAVGSTADVRNLATATTQLATTGDQPRTLWLLAVKSLSDGRIAATEIRTSAGTR